MQISQVLKIEDRKNADVLILPFWQGKAGAVMASEIGEFTSLITPVLDSGDFKGKEGESVLLYQPKDSPKKKNFEKRVLLLGLGDQKKATKESMRRSYAHAMKVCRHKKLESINLVFAQVKEGGNELHLAVLEGTLLANYSFDSLKGETAKEELKPLVAKLCFIGIDKKSFESFKKVESTIDSVHFARDLVNGNADDVTPQLLEKKARELASEFASIKATILTKAQIEKEGLGLLLAVNRGSNRDPAFIVMEYKGNPSSKETTALVGKGVTYDTGGLNIKQTGQMETMKCDMAGAAVVLATLQAAAKLKLKANLIGVVVSTENAIGPLAYKPGDVYKSFSGKTVEISNTDAEGRLILADALSYIQKKYKPTQIIDLATLTGGIVIALGEEATGLFSNDDKLSQKLLKAGERTYERLWRFPLFPEYRECLKSSIADLRSSGGKKASSITAAFFLQEFIKEVPWAHLDIAGTAFLSETKPYHPTLATGVGVRLLIDFLEAHDS